MSNYSQTLTPTPRLRLRSPMSEDTVRVAVRIRPLIKSEIDKGCQTCLTVVPGEQQIIVRNTEKAFTFNYVFPGDVHQEDFYETAIKGMVENIFKGYNVTILAYGQTGSGKTYSMGTNYIATEETGVIPRAVHNIFQIIESKEDWSFNVSVSFMELYQEQLYDLLADKPRNQSIVDIRDDGKNVKVSGVVENVVTNAQEALQCLTQGSLGRVTGATAMNAQSSRSHAIFTICIHQQKQGDPSTATTAKFHLVDLAGSERSKKTQATGERFKEGVNINKGLLTLGNVISQLGEGGPNTYIGYRDSKLTRLLQDSLGGNSMTLMIACVSPADYNLDETLSTLRYADRARKIKNKPVINQDPQLLEINRLNKIAQELKLALVDQEIRVSCPLEHQELQEKNQSLLKKFRDLTEKLNENLIEIVIMHEKAELAEQCRAQIQADVMKIIEECREILNEFDKNPESYAEHRAKVEALYLKIIDMDTDHKKKSEELVDCGMTSDSCTSKKDDEEETVMLQANSSHRDSINIDEKQEEHTLLQVKRNNQVQGINKELAIKEGLISYLLKNSSTLIDYSKEIEEMEQKIKTLQTERKELMQELQNVQTNNATSKLAESCRKKVQELEKETSELQRKIVERDRILKTKNKQDQQIKQLSKEMTSLKQTRVKLIRQMRNESDRFSKWKESKEKELNRLKDQNRKQDNEVTRLKMWQSKQENVFKRKMEESFAVNKRLKDALDLQKKAAAMRKAKQNNNPDKIKNWLEQEIQVLISTVDAEFLLEKLMSDRASLAATLKRLQDSDDPNEEKITEFSEFLGLRNAQITDLQQKIVESDQESRKNTRWQTVHTMEEGKAALKILFKQTAENRRKLYAKKFDYNDLLEKCEILEAQVEECKAKEKERRISRQLTLNKTTNRNTEVDEEKKNMRLKQELEHYKEKYQHLERMVLTEVKNKNKVSEPRSKIKRETRVVELIDENSIPEFDETFGDDDYNDDCERDPDWTRTPLYKRIQKLSNTTKTDSSERSTLKRSSDGDLKCGCKTKCASRICSCRKNKVACKNCGCDPTICQNRDANDVRQTLFDYTGTENEVEPIKKLRLEEQDQE
ncbi:chromosome-associated kinesin KIF4-like isoform X2 [Lasioglossum baleicum]|uniref:chromosome-associated kinesin KIF4-like isoform X2 n=1 Tax=Lasioglossum baleicum TaxID=434251 RepID=UPI003FCDC7A1